MALIAFALLAGIGVYAAMSGRRTEATRTQDGLVIQPLPEGAYGPVPIEGACVWKYDVALPPGVGGLGFNFDVKHDGVLGWSPESGGVGGARNGHVVIAFAMTPHAEYQFVTSRGDPAGWRLATSGSGDTFSIFTSELSSGRGGPSPVAPNGESVLITRDIGGSRSFWPFASSAHTMSLVLRLHR